jgi:hypothetical protein
MYANFVEIVVRKSVSDYDEEADEVLVVRAYPADETVDAERMTQETRAWLLDGRRTRFFIGQCETAASARRSSAGFGLERSRRLAPARRRGQSSAGGSPDSGPPDGTQFRCLTRLSAGPQRCGGDRGIASEVTRFAEERPTIRAGADQPDGR